MRRIWMVVCLALVSASCAGADVVSHDAPGDAPPTPSEAPLLSRKLGDGKSELSFPPPNNGARARADMPNGYGVSSASELVVDSPSLDGKGRFRIHDRFFFVRFNQPVAGAKSGLPAGNVLSFDPPVAGLSRWEDARTVRFDAGRFLDPEKSFTVKVSALESATGVKLSPWKATMRSAVGATIADKTIGYVPKPGEHRIVATLPDGGEVGRTPRFRILFDQPIHIAVARKLIKLSYKNGNPIALSYDHPTADVFNGARVDRRFVVVATPKFPLFSSTEYVLDARDGLNVDSPLAHPVNVTVAPRLTFSGASCGWYDRDDEVCAVEGTTLRTDQREIHIRFANRLRGSDKKLAAHVRVTPSVRNLTITKMGWDSGRLVLRGDFRPSLNYRITVAGLEDVYRQKQQGAVRLDVRMMPLGASVSMPEGLIVLDQRSTKSFALASRNIEQAELRFWEVKDNDVSAFRKALEHATRGTLSGEKPSKTKIVEVRAKRDTLVSTKVDLGAVLSAGASYLATVVPKRVAFSAAPLKFPAGSAADRPPVALLKPGRPGSLRVHSHSVGKSTIVQVARLSSGKPIAGARVALSSDAAKSVVTDAQGVAVLAADTTSTTDDFVQVRADGDTLLLPLSRSHSSSSQLFPHLSRGSRVDSSQRAMVITDRGIYRPGATIGIKASVFLADGGKLKPAAAQSLGLSVVGPTGQAVCKRTLTSGDMGSVADRCKLPAGAKLGLHRVVVTRAGSQLAHTVVRVAEFEPPKFKVDVEPDKDAPEGRVRAVIQARYLFGAAMGGATADWNMRRADAPFPSGPLTDAGLQFRRERSWLDDEEDASWSQTGAVTLDDSGRAVLDQVGGMEGARGPQQFTIEADVSDSSARHVAARTTVIAHPASRYAGLRVQGGWVGVGDELDAELGVIDRAGKPIVGAKVVARLLAVEWRLTRRRSAGGGMRSEWRRSENEVTRCAVKSRATPTSCQLRVPKSGDFRVVASVEGREGGSRWVWAWSSGSDRQTKPAPSKGSVVQLMADKGRYRPGDKARLIARNPFPKAIAVLTTQMGELLSHQSKRVDGSAAVFEIPIEARHSPHVHATVTLLPLGAEGEDIAAYRVAALRLGVERVGQALAVDVSSDRSSYRPGEQAELTVKVLDGGKPARGAEVALAVVDEGVLRLTNFSAADPVSALHPPSALSFLVRDSRGGLAQLFERSHTAGDGGGDELGSMPHTRRRFVRTALFEPQLRTDERGEAHVRLRLPDNLTEFRMMAVVVDAAGKGGKHEASFTVNKPVMLQAVLPRFGHVGDSVELAAMVHNNGDQPFEGVARIDGVERKLKLAAGGRTRVGVMRQLRRAGERKITLAVEDGRGAVVDSAERRLRVELPGLHVQPSLSSAFAGEQQIALKIPDGILAGPQAELVVQAGEHIWPELGERLDYLLDYPHGCVEQTTSSTLPLIAARDILPRIGADKYGDAFFRERINAGLKRLDSMRTSSGGLAYWPGGSEPHLYGTAYAMQAVARAKQLGIAPPAGLLDGMTRYLIAHLKNAHGSWERVAVGLALSEAGALPAAISDALWDHNGDLNTFETASLVLALGKLDGQQDRVDELIKQLEERVDDDGKLKDEKRTHRWGYFQSDRRTMAQVVIALARHKRASTALPMLASRIADDTGGYTTQATAFGLLALAETLKASPKQGAAVTALLDGEPVPVKRRIGHSGVELRIPLSALSGKIRTLKLAASGKAAIGFRLHASYRVPLASQAAMEGPQSETPSASGGAMSGVNGPDVYRVFTDPRGGPIDLSKLETGDMVRVALMMRMPGGDERGYLAVTDRFAAGFEPVDPNLATVAQAPEVSEAHPFWERLRYNYNRASHVELRDDRVQIYFDRVYGDTLVASYLLRATTPGKFVLPPAAAELMYQADSLSYSDGGRVVIQ